MKLFKLRNRPHHPQADQPEMIGQPEPQGHLHPNYRHWNWFRPGDRPGE